MSVGSILFCFLHVLDSNVANPPHSLRAEQLGVSRDPARGGLEPGGDLGCASGAEAIVTFAGCYPFPQQPGLQGYPPDRALPQLPPSKSLIKTIPTFQHFIPARRLNLGRKE